MDCFCGKPGWCWFKLALFGIMMSFILALVGIIPPFSSMLVSFPLAWIMAILFLIPSLVIYYSVKDKFWAAVMEEKSGKK